MFYPTMFLNSLLIPYQPNVFSSGIFISVLVITTSSVDPGLEAKQKKDSLKVIFNVNK